MSRLLKRFIMPEFSFRSLSSELEVTERQVDFNDKDALLDCHDPTPSVNCQMNQRRKLLTLINSAFFIFSIVVLSFTIIVNWDRWTDENYYIRHVTEYSPILNEMKIELRTTLMDATLLESKEDSIFRQPPSKEVDAAWDRLANVQPIPITRQDVIRLGKDPEQAAKFPESFGLGSSAYIGRLDVFHVIHCLDQVRREANFEHYYGRHWGTPQNASELHKTHISHCFHILLQNLMCSTNLDVYTHFWADAQLNAFPDFTVNHRCFDFEGLLKWQETNSIPVKDFAAIRRPEDYKAHVMTPKFKELFGYEGPGQFVGDEIG